MVERRVAREIQSSTTERDPTQYCPNCGARGEWQKCKLVCTNEKCGVRIILACVD